MKALTKTDFHFPGQQSVYHGKVRDVYHIGGYGSHRPYFSFRRHSAQRHSL